MMDGNADSFAPAPTPAPPSAPSEGEPTPRVDSLAASAEPRVAAPGARSGLVGREVETAALHAALAEVGATGAVSVSTVLGSSGMGKTRLVRDFLTGLEGAGPDAEVRDGKRPLAPRVFRGTAPEQGGAFAVFARLLRSRFGVLEGMQNEEASAAIRAQLVTILDDRKVGDVAYFLGKLLDLDFPRSPITQVIESAPQELHRLRRVVIKRFLEADCAASGRATILVLDDLHWADDESLDLLAYLMDELRAPVLLLCLARPELLARRDGWLREGGERHTKIELSPLGDTEANGVARGLLAPCGDDPAVTDLIDAATGLAGGNPALLERAVRIFQDIGVLQGGDEFAEEEAWTIHLERLADVHMPLTVDDAVQARISALSPDERVVLERAASMGSVFWLGGLVVLQRLGDVGTPAWDMPRVATARPPSPEGEPSERPAASRAPSSMAPSSVGRTAADLAALRRTLRDLIARDYVLRLPDSTRAGDEEYVFKHNLEREKLAALTPPGLLRQQHRALAEWLALDTAALAHEETVALLGRYYEQAGAPSRAAMAYLDAGKRAQAEGATARAAEHYARGLALVAAGAEVGVERHVETVQRYGDALRDLGRTQEAALTYRELFTRAYRANDLARGGLALRRLGRLDRDAGRLDAAAERLTDALRLLDAAADDGGVASAVDDLGKIEWLRGNLAHALELVQRGLVMRRAIGDTRGMAQSSNNLGLVLEDLGELGRAYDAFDQALALHRAQGDAVGAGNALSRLAALLLAKGDPARALPLLEEAHAALVDRGVRERLPAVLLQLAEAHLALRAPDRALQRLDEASKSQGASPSLLLNAEVARLRALASAAKGQHDRARTEIRRAIDLLDTESATATPGKGSRDGDGDTLRLELAYALRTEAELLIQLDGSGAVPRARAAFLRSIALFEAANDLRELARTCRLYADLVYTLVAHSDPTVAAETLRCAARAAQIDPRG